MREETGGGKLRTINFDPQFIDLVKSGRKTQTRRPIKPLKDKCSISGYFDCRYGVPGEILKVNNTDVCIRIESIRVELLHDISEESAINEGVERGIFEKFSTAFLYLLDGIYKNTQYKAGVNPWVWVIEFKKLEVDG